MAYISKAQRPVRGLVMLIGEEYGGVDLLEPLGLLLTLHVAEWYLKTNSFVEHTNTKLLYCG